MYYFTWKEELVSNILWVTAFGNNILVLTCPQTTSKLISLTILVTQRPCTQLQPKSEAIPSQKSVTLSLTW